MTFLVETESGGVLPISNMYDEHGNETQDCLRAISIVARLPDGQWLSAPIIPDAIHTVH